MNGKAAKHVEVRHFGQLVRDKRNELGLSLDSLSDVTGIDRANLSSIENGKRIAGPRVRPNLMKSLSITEQDIELNDALRDGSKAQFSSFLIGEGSTDVLKSTFDEIILATPDLKIEEAVANIGIKLNRFKDERDLRRAFSYFSEAAMRFEDNLEVFGSTEKFMVGISNAIKCGDGVLAMQLLEAQESFDNHASLAGLKVRIAGHIALNNLDVAAREIRDAGAIAIKLMNDEMDTILLHCLSYAYNSFRALKAPRNTLLEICDYFGDLINGDAQWRFAYSLNLLRAKILREESTGKIGFLALRQLERARYSASKAFDIAKHHKVRELQLVARLEATIIEMLKVHTKYLSRHDPLIPQASQSKATYDAYNKPLKMYEAIADELQLIWEQNAGLTQIIDLHLIIESIPGFAKAEDPLDYFRTFGDDQGQKDSIRDVAIQATQILLETGYRREYVDSKVKLSIAGLQVESNMYLVPPEKQKISLDHFADVSGSLRLYFSKPMELERYVVGLAETRRHEFEKSGSQS